MVSFCIIFGGVCSNIPTGIKKQRKQIGKSGTSKGVTILSSSWQFSPPSVYYKLMLTPDNGLGKAEMARCLH